MAVGILLVAGKCEAIVGGLLRLLHGKVHLQVLGDDVLLSVDACIIDDGTDKREGRLLHTEAVHGLHNVVSMVEGRAKHDYLMSCLSAHYSFFFLSISMISLYSL